MTDQQPAFPRRILLATDLSARCDRATDRTLHLARAWDAEVVIGHAIAPSLDSADDERAIARARANATMLIARDFGDAHGVTPRVHIEKGRPDEVILELADRVGADLIVTGVASNDWLGQAVLGTTSLAVAQRARVPLLVVKKRATAPYNKVVVALDTSEASVPALAYAAGNLAEARLSVFHAFALPFQSFSGDVAEYERQKHKRVLAELAEVLGAVPLARDLAVTAVAGEAAPALARHAVEHDVDLVVAGTHGRTGLLGALLGSVAREMLSQVPCDVLIVPSKGARENAR
jgi:nucleotide-binding universal stress UspA family protein